MPGLTRDTGDQVSPLPFTGLEVEAALKDAYSEYKRSGRLPEEFAAEDLGYHLAMASRFEEAAWCFDHAAPTDSKRIELTLWWRAVIAHVRGRDPDARRFIRQFAAIAPASIDLPRFARTAASASGDLSWGHAWLRRGLGISPKESPSFRSLADHVRVLRDSSYAADRAPRGTRPVTLLVMGQSNAGNSSDVGLSVSGNARVFRSGRYYPMIDPLIGADGRGGSIWSRLARRLLDADFCDEVVVACVTRGSSTMEDWATAGTFGLERMCRDLQTSGVDVTHVLWQQGEQETARGTTKDAYLTGLRRLRERLLGGGVAAPVYCALSTRVRERTCPEVAKAIGEAALAVDGIRLGPDTDVLGSDYRKDGTHLDAKGQDAAAGLWFDVLTAGT